ncbi:MULTISPECIES: sensor histidine kinase [unclassified Polaribacter]|uniref:sensor histidine kinase n=1 Tax=unclassified Polaribacter TaxID=196858 RepID=UPI0011BE2BD7|nr:MULTISPECIES: HAMP domain-containing sensor histidine kinase [unclassified Polaribacter]TXD48482.1 HAMP domain-containing histidine kinase [Polaribacter sp. IC063]TXD62322.1 HAMP domain-containing histidine kinase [Polaribacter sp. IC066]
MNTKKYTWIFYLISLTIVATIGIQLYWNYKNYEENKRQVTNEIQLSLDNAIEEYFAKLAKEEFTTIINLNEGKVKTLSNNKIKFDSIFKNSPNFKKIKSFIKKDTLNKEPEFQITNISFTSDDSLDAKKTDSIIRSMAKGMSSEQKKSKQKSTDNLSNNFKYFSGKKSADSLKLIKYLNPIFLSVASNSIEYHQLDSLLKNQLNKKNIPLQFVFNHLKKDTIFYTSNDSLISKNLSKCITSKSTYLKKDEKFKLLYNISNTEAIKRSSFGIFLSLLLSLAVISSLFYLLKIINQQKALAAIKNDLISNITHEFKTPIATVSAAIEAIENFNILDDKEKTKKYLAMSSFQIKKLHQMVEKLLETATLDSEQLLLKKETVDVVEIAERLVIKHQLLASTKELLFSSNLKPIYCKVDVFHFENVISNLIDNAVKYGGDQIQININSILKSTEIIIADNGSGIEKNEQEKIFDQFYRIPKGNTHDVKGFGIGLYYSKKIIEKHAGSLSLSSDKKQTLFKITMPNE